MYVFTVYVNILSVNAKRKFFTLVKKIFIGFVIFFLVM